MRRCGVVAQDAVALALTFDRAVASAVAARAEDDEALQRKLWLAIARHLIGGASESSADPARALRICPASHAWPHQDLHYYLPRYNGKGTRVAPSGKGKN